MKITLPMALAVVLVSSCSSLATNQVVREEPWIDIETSYVDALNDREPANRREELGASFQVKPGKAQRYLFFLSHAVQCTNGRTSCREALVRPELEISVQPIDSQTFKVRGFLRTDVGRSFTASNSSPGAFELTVTGSLNSDIPLIGEFSDQAAFEKIVRRGEKIELKGVLGYRAFVSVR